jgi:hypothetical protein
MFVMFEEAGIFIVSYYHRLVLLMCDMMKSGELYVISISDKSCTNWQPSAKHVLAIVDCLIDIIGSKVGCAYDIRCAFVTTLENSSLSEKVKDAIFHMMVGAFHGHVHNQTCQLEWHPLYIKGTGYSDGERCEHVFTSSNDLTCGTLHVLGSR